MQLPTKAHCVLPAMILPKILQCRAQKLRFTEVATETLRSHAQLQHLCSAVCSSALQAQPGSGPRADHGTASVKSLAFSRLISGGGGGGLAGGRWWGGRWGVGLLHTGGNVVTEGEGDGAKHVPIADGSGHVQD